MMQRYKTTADNLASVTYTPIFAHGSASVAMAALLKLPNLVSRHCDAFPFSTATTSSKTMRHNKMTIIMAKAYPLVPLQIS